VIPAERRAKALAATGFMPANEGDALHAAAVTAGHMLPGLPFVEIGSYCGRSTVWLADAAEQCKTVLYAIDHHRGSEENQAGWEHHDISLVDADVGRMDTLPRFRRTLFDAGLEPVVVAMIGQSPTIARHWRTPCAFVFIDGGHGVEPASSDYNGWTPHVAPGGILAIHDVFPDPADGGRPPYEDIYQPAIASRLFREISATGSLRVLRRVV
jgi:MMP 1-O-methyltransferase